MDSLSTPGTDSPAQKNEPCRFTLLASVTSEDSSRRLCLSRLSPAFCHKTLQYANTTDLNKWVFALDFGANNPDVLVVAWADGEGQPLFSA